MMPVAIYRVPDSARPQKYNLQPSVELPLNISIDHVTRKQMLVVMHSDSDIEDNQTMAAQKNIGQGKKI